MFKSIAGDIKIVCDEVIYVVHILSANVVNSAPTNLTSTLSINCHNKK